MVYVRKYGSGEPTDEMVEAIYSDIKDCYYSRVFAIGGGTIIDVAKFFALQNVSPVLDLYDRKLEIKKAKELFILPTTCGTGSVMTGQGRLMANNYVELDRETVYEIYRKLF